LLCNAEETLACFLKHKKWPEFLPTMTGIFVPFLFQIIAVQAVATIVGVFRLITCSD